MSQNQSESLIYFCALMVMAGSAMAFVHERGDSALAEKEFTDPALEVSAVYERPDNLPRSLQGSVWDALGELGVDAEQAIFDRRSGRWGALYPATPLIPGSGIGNQLAWEDLGFAAPAGTEEIADAAWRELSSYLEARADVLGIDLSELEHRVGVHNDGDLIQFSISRNYQGLPVRGAVFTAGISHGNLALMGFDAWGDIDLDLRPRISADDALATVADFARPTDLGSLREEPSLAIVPSSSGSEFAIGAGYHHRLVWVLGFDVPGDFGRWEALVDAHRGQLLSFKDLNSYQRVVDGGIYPITYDGIGPEGNMQPNYPMPFADITVGGPFTDSGGNFSGSGNATTTLSGQFIRIDDQCPGVFSESSTGDILLGGNNGDVDCMTPTSGDNTASARSGFYELNRMVEQAQAQLPANTWLMNQLEANMNITSTCNAFWNGTTINFFREGFPCGNTGQIGSVFDHEWGHGMDDNDVQGSVISSFNGGGEGIADLYASLRLDTSCVGRGFWINGQVCTGYGDPCTAASACTGIRDIDWANRTSGVPHTLTWVQTCGCCGAVHCRGAVYAETVWDLFKRDLPTLYGMDNNTAMEVTTRLNYLAAGILSGWYPVTGTPHANCNANFSYNQFLLADDDDGNLANGTPHMTAIATAFERHEIDCSPANGGPIVQDSGCAGNPALAPVVTGTPTNNGADLSWSSVAGASSYNVYRTDGVFGCDFGKTLVGSTTGTTFSDTGLKNGHDYFYTVIPMGAGGASCFGPASACTTVTPADCCSQPLTDTEFFLSAPGSLSVPDSSYAYCAMAGAKHFSGSYCWAEHNSTTSNWDFLGVGPSASCGYICIDQVGSCPASPYFEEFLLTGTSNQTLSGTDYAYCAIGGAKHDPNTGYCWGDYNGVTNTWNLSSINASCNFVCIPEKSTCSNFKFKEITLSGPASQTLSDNDFSYCAVSGDKHTNSGYCWLDHNTLAGTWQLEAVGQATCNFECIAK